MSGLTQKGARGYVQPNQCFKLIIAFVTQPGVTNVIVLEKFRIGGDALQFATFWAGASREILFINVAPRSSDAGHHAETL